MHTAEQLPHKDEKHKCTSSLDYCLAIYTEAEHSTIRHRVDSAILLLSLYMKEVGVVIIKRHVQERL